MIAEFCSESHNPLPDRIMHVIGLLVSLLTVTVFSVTNVSVLNTLTLLPQPHHSFPALGSILDTGIAVVPTDTVVGDAVFQPPATTVRGYNEA